MRDLARQFCRRTLLLMGVLAGQPGAAYAQDNGRPAFLPDYYASQLTIAGETLHPAGHTLKDRFDQYVYTTQDDVVRLEVGSILCGSASCATVYNNAARYFDQQASPNGGRFELATPTEFRVAWQTGLGDISTFAFLLPSSILIWNYTARLPRDLGLDARFTALRLLADRQRYEQAMQAGNVELGRWDEQLRDYAHALVQQGHRAAALEVFRALLANAPQDYQAQLEFAATTTDQQAAHDSAQAVYDNAESSDLTGQAADLLARAEPGIDSLPVLSDGERGLQVVIIALPPCDVRLLRDGARMLGRTLDMPVKVVRLGEAWPWGPPERIADQRAIQQIIVQRQGPTVEFDGWTVQRYREALMRSVEGKGALARYNMETYVNKLPERPGQYRVGPYLDRLLDILARHRSDDHRTMYVGVTANNIFDDTDNYVFSMWTAHDGAGVSLLSYAMMTAKQLNEPYESRRRLTERLAKELVPASLKSLGIPRPVDPTDPYSYSNGVARLAEKSLELSPRTRAALDKFR